MNCTTELLREKPPIGRFLRYFFVLDKEAWVEANKNIGRLLGYPKTAVAEYIKFSSNEEHL